MKTKRFAMLLGILLVTTTAMVKAQTPFDWGDVPYEIVGNDTISTAVDTTRVILPDNKVDTVYTIQMSPRTWARLESQLKAEFTKSSGKTTTNSVTKQEIAWIYEVDGIPVKTGQSKLYLSLLKAGGYFISCTNPNTVSTTVCPCYFQLSSAGVHQTDDEFFDKHTTTGENRIIKNFW